MRELCSRLVQLPPATNGMALGLCGAASVLLELGADERAALCVMIPATALWILFSLRMLAAPGQAREELAMSRTRQLQDASTGPTERLQESCGRTRVADNGAYR